MKTYREGKKGYNKIVGWIQQFFEIFFAIISVKFISLRNYSKVLLVTKLTYLSIFHFLFTFYNYVTN